MCRAELDSHIHEVLIRARKDLAVTEVAKRADVSVMAAVYSLGRLVARGEAEVSAVTVAVDYGRRPYTTIRMYRKPRPVTSVWPAWLLPVALPPVVSVRRQTGVF